MFSRNPEDTLNPREVDYAVPVRALTRKEVTHQIERLDLFIVGGGGILFDGEAEKFMREVLIAHGFGIPVAVYAVSAGPLNTRSVRHAVRTGLNKAAVVTVRDRLGYRLLEDVGVDREIYLRPTRLC